MMYVMAFVLSRHWVKLWKLTWGILGDNVDAQYCLILGWVIVREDRAL